MKLLSLFILILAVVGCADGLDGMLKTGPSEPGLSCPSEPQTFDLGTGRAPDIGRLAPTFFANDYRYRTIKPNVPGLTAVKPTMVNGVDGFEFMVTEPSYGVRVLSTEGGTILLVTPGQCPHLLARERCVDDRLRTEVEATDKIACLGPVSVAGDHVLISLEGSDEKLKAFFGEPLLINPPRGSVSFDLFVPGSDKPAGHVTRRRDDTSKPLPSEVLALLKPGGLEKVAMLFYRDLPVKTAEFDTKVVQLRVAGAKKVAAQYDDPRRLVELIQLHTMKTLPGDNAVFPLLALRIREVLPGLVDVDANAAEFKVAALAFAFAQQWSDEPINLSLVEAKYGPLLLTARPKNRDAQQAFAVMFPESRFLQELEAAQAKEAEERRQEQARLAKEADEQELWNEVQMRGDEIATLAYKIQFGRQNFLQTRHNLRGLASIEKYREGLIRDAYCPAKAAFMKAKGNAAFNERAAQHCRDEAPTDVGVGGVEKQLTAECRAAFAIGC
jgi:hypothetical protein